MCFVVHTATNREVRENVSISCASIVFYPHSITWAVFSLNAEVDLYPSIDHTY